MMAWGWALKMMGTRSQSSGLFGYLTTRNRNITRIKLEKARQEATKEIIDHLPSGAVYREGTPDGWREIRMPMQPKPPVVVSVEKREPSADPHRSTELQLPRKALDQ